MTDHSAANASPDFSSLGLSPELMRAVREQDYTTPSPIQQQAIPLVLQGRDVMAAAQTGTGKTAGFTLPILDRLMAGPQAQSNEVRALILTPTRELAAQVQNSVSTYGAHLPLRSEVVFGGVKINPQMMRLRRGVDVLVATPGRLIDLYQQKAVRFNRVEILVLDEADRMLDMGFIHDIRRILALLPKKRQNLMFSATFSQEIRTLAKGLVNDPVEISVTPRNTTVEAVDQCIHPVDKKRKPALLAKLIEDNDWRQVLVFSRTKHGANKLARFLDEQGISALPIHGNKSQSARTKALDGFKRGKVRVLVATDIAARGIDIEQLPQVVNVDLPNVPEDYVHRIGRTGRAGATGHAVSLVSADEVEQLAAIEKLTRQLLRRELIGGFEPVHDVPVTALNQRAPRNRTVDGESPSNGRGRGSGGPRSGGPRAGGQRSGGQRTAGGARSGGPRQEGQRSGEQRQGGPRTGGEGRAAARADGQRPAGSRASGGRSDDNRGNERRPSSDRSRTGGGDQPGGSQRRGPRPSGGNRY
ncbi:DEAD/DEAH box helicase [Gammaproteobacteria bacterium]|nr:DEAD/DEAH box helicase [Gammaproteobacteria bacterium]